MADNTRKTSNIIHTVDDLNTTVNEIKLDVSNNTQDIGNIKVYDADIKLSANQGLTVVQNGNTTANAQNPSEWKLKADTNYLNTTLNFAKPDQIPTVYVKDIQSGDITTLQVTDDGNGTYTLTAIGGGSGGGGGFENITLAEGKCIDITTEPYDDNGTEKTKITVGTDTDCLNTTLNFAKSTDIITPGDGNINLSASNGIKVTENGNTNANATANTEWKLEANSTEIINMTKGNLALNDLSDVDASVSSGSENKVLGYDRNNNKWIAVDNGNGSGGGTAGVQSLEGLEGNLTLVSDDNSVLIGDIEGSTSQIDLTVNSSALNIPTGNLPISSEDNKVTLSDDDGTFQIETGADEDSKTSRVYVEADGKFGVGKVPTTRFMVGDIDDSEFFFGTGFTYVRQDNDNQSGLFLINNNAEGNAKRGIWGLALEDGSKNDNSLYIYNSGVSGVGTDPRFEFTAGDSNHLILHKGQLQTDTITTKDATSGDPADGKKDGDKVIRLKGNQVQITDQDHNPGTGGYSLDIRDNRGMFRLRNDDVVNGINDTATIALDVSSNTHNSSIEFRTGNVMRAEIVKQSTAGNQYWAQYCVNGSASGLEFRTAYGAVTEKTFETKSDATIISTFNQNNDPDSDNFRGLENYVDRLTVTATDIKAADGYEPQTEYSLVTKGWVQANTASGNFLPMAGGTMDAAADVIIPSGSSVNANLMVGGTVGDTTRSSFNIAARGTTGQQNAQLVSWAKPGGSAYLKLCVTEDISSYWNIFGSAVNEDGTTYFRVSSESQNWVTYSNTTTAGDRKITHTPYTQFDSYIGTRWIYTNAKAENDAVFGLINNQVDIIRASLDVQPMLGVSTLNGYGLGSDGIVVESADVFTAPEGWDEETQGDAAQQPDQPRSGIAFKGPYLLDNEAQNYYASIEGVRGGRTNGYKSGACRISVNSTGSSVPSMNQAAYFGWDRTIVKAGNDTVAANTVWGSASIVHAAPVVINVPVTSNGIGWWQSNFYDGSRANALGWYPVDYGGGTVNGIGAGGTFLWADNGNGLALAADGIRINSQASGALTSHQWEFTTEGHLVSQGGRIQTDTITSKDAATGDAELQFSNVFNFQFRNSDGGDGSKINVGYNETSGTGFANVGVGGCYWYLRDSKRFGIGATGINFNANAAANASTYDWSMEPDGTFVSNADRGIEAAYITAGRNNSGASLATSPKITLSGVSALLAGSDGSEYIPTDDNSLVTKKYVDDKIGGGGGGVDEDTVPGSGANYRWNEKLLSVPDTINGVIQNNRQVFRTLYAYDGIFTDGLHWTPDGYSWHTSDQSAYLGNLENSITDDLGRVCKGTGNEYVVSEYISNDMKSWRRLGGVDGIGIVYLNGEFYHSDCSYKLDRPTSSWVGTGYSSAVGGSLTSGPSRVVACMESGLYAVVLSAVDGTAHWIVALDGEPIPYRAIGNGITGGLSICFSERFQKWMIASDDTFWISDDANVAATNWTEMALPTAGNWDRMVDDGGTISIASTDDNANIVLYCQEPGGPAASADWQTTTLYNNRGYKGFCGTNGRTIGSMEDEANVTDPSTGDKRHDYYYAVSGDVRLETTTDTSQIQLVSPTRDLRDLNPPVGLQTQSDANQFMAAEIAKRAIVVTLTQAEYDALSPPDENTLYLIT